VDAPFSDKTVLRRYGHAALLAVLFVGGVVFRLAYIRGYELWVDELWSLGAAAPRFTTAQVIQNAIADAHPPLFDVLLHGWLRLSPNDLFWGRYLSLLFGAAGMVLTYSYTRRMTGSQAAAALAFSLVAFNHFHVVHSIEARYYALLYFLGLGVASHLVFYLRGDGRIHLLLFALWSAAILYTHIFGALLLAGLSATVAVTALAKKIPAKTFLQFLGVCIALGVLYLPFALSLRPSGANISWLEKPQLSAFFIYLYGYSNKNPGEAAVVGLPVLLAFFLPKKRDWFPAKVLLGAILITYLAAFAVSVTVRPILHMRYTVVYLPSLFILAALVWQRLLGRRRGALLVLGAAVLASVVVVQGWTMPFGQHLHHEPWRAMAERLKRDSDASASLYAEDPRYINFYLRKSTRPLAKRVADGLPTEPTFMYVRSEYDTLGIPQAARAVVFRRQDFSNGYALEWYRR